MTKLRDMNLLARDPQCEIHCGSLRCFGDWIGAQPGMRQMSPDEIPIPMFAGVKVVENHLFPANQVVIKTSTETRIFIIG